MNAKIQDGINDEIQKVLDRSMSAILYNLNNVFGGLLYSVKLECEKEGGVGDIDKLIRHVANTSRYTGPEGEEYPVWDEYNKEIVAIRQRLYKILQKHGIEQFDFGRVSTKNND